MADLDPSLKAIFGMKPDAVIEFLKNKKLATTWNFNEMKGDAHNHAFTVAKVMRRDILQDIRNGITSILEDGKTYKQVQENLVPILQAKGWWGKQDVADPRTGEIRQVQLGSPQRMKTIFQTNLQKAYMEERIRTSRELVDIFPYWQWVAVMDGRTRPSHRAMDGRVFMADDPLWTVVAKPPSGYRCRCRHRALTKHIAEREGFTVESSEGRIVDHEIRVGGEMVPVKALRIQVNGQDKLFFADAGFSPARGDGWQAAFTPRPLDAAPATFPRNMVTPKPFPPLPVPVAFPASRLLGSGLAPEVYAMTFLAEFKAAIGKPVTYLDVTAEPLMINEGLFKDDRGAWKITKRGRAENILLLADTIKQPDEIWLRWEESRNNPGKWLLKRRYLKAFIAEQDGVQVYGVGAFEYSKEGWVGSTAFQASADTEVKRRAYFEAQRDGFLLYQKK